MAIAWWCSICAFFTCVVRSLEINIVSILFVPLTYLGIYFWLGLIMSMVSIMFPCSFSLPTALEGSFVFALASSPSIMLWPCDCFSHTKFVRSIQHCCLTLFMEPTSGSIEYN